MMSDEAVNATQEVNVEVDLAPEAHTDAGALSFDELDALTDSRSGEQVINEAKEKVAEKNQENEPKAEVQSGGEESQEESKISEEAVEEIKKILARQGDDELEIAADALFKQKVDGEEVDVSLQDLLNNYSGKTSYDKKFQELSSSKKEFEGVKETFDNDVQQIQNYVKTFNEKMMNNDALGALEYFAEFSGMKPYEFRRELLKSLTPAVERYQKLSEEELRNEELVAQNDYLIKQQESAQERQQHEQAVEELRAEIAKVQEAHGMNDDSFRESYKELQELGYEGEIKPQDVAEFYMHKNAYMKTDEILNSVNPALAANDEIVESLQKIIIENPSFDNNDLSEIVMEVFGDFVKETSKTVSKKVEKPVEKKQSINNRSKEAFMSFDDL